MDEGVLQPDIFPSPDRFLTLPNALTTMPTMLEGIIQSIPPQAGSYVLWLHLPQTQDLTVGRLGSFTFSAGDYIYLGSAQGPDGLRARLGRHLLGSGQPHWHIDRLRVAAQVRGFGYQVSAGLLQSTECRWSQRLATLPDASHPVPGFGSSDCRSGCTAHLVCFPDGIEQTFEDIAYQIGVPLKNI